MNQTLGVLGYTHCNDLICLNSTLTNDNAVYRSARMFSYGCGSWSGFWKISDQHPVWTLRSINWNPQLLKLKWFLRRTVWEVKSVVHYEYFSIPGRNTFGDWLLNSSLAFRSYTKNLSLRYSRISGFFLSGLRPNIGNLVISQMPDIREKNTLN